MLTSKLRMGKTASCVQHGKHLLSATSRIEIIVMRNNDLNWWPLEGNLHWIYFDGNIFFYAIEGKEKLNIVTMTNDLYYVNMFL